MKFSNTLEFNAVRGWDDYYLNYERLKRKIYDMELERSKFWKENRVPEDQLPALMEPMIQRFQAEFIKDLKEELSRINGFYTEKERELVQEVDQLEAFVLGENSHISITIPTSQPSATTAATTPSTTLTVSRESPAHSQGFATPRSSLSPLTNEYALLNNNTTPASVDAVDSPILNDNPMVGEMQPLLFSSSAAPRTSRQQPKTVRFSSFLEKMDFHDKAKDLYVNVCSLKEYVVLNYTGFGKIVKKFDKVLDGHLRSLFMPFVEESYFWTQNSDSAHHAILNELIERIIHMYANVICDGNQHRAISELGHHLREYVVWERNTIWRDMVGRERRVTAVGVKRVDVHSKPGFQIRLPFKVHVTLNLKMLWLAVGFVLLLTLVAFPLVAESLNQSKCLAVLLFASWLWATEALPLFVTSLLVPFLVIVLDVMPGDGSKADKVKRVFHFMFDPVIMLLLGGFSIAAALSKYHIAKRMASQVLSRVGSRPNSILLSIMFVATFSSMWMSNVAAPVLCFSVVQPILRTLEPGNQFAKSLVMGIALASNIGGMVTPISSPQNAFAVTYLTNVSWPVWLGVTIPLSILSVLLCWVLLVVVYKPSGSVPRIQPIRATADPLTGKQIFIIFVTLATIGLWCFESTLKDVFGHGGVIAVLPLIVFFGTGLLTKDDFNNFLWTVVILAMGGIVLGNAVKETDLLHYIANLVVKSLNMTGLWVMLLVFCSAVLVAATFISHSVSAFIILPIVKQVGETMGLNSNILVMGSMLMCSAAMGLPVSGFPNITAISLEDPTGRPYIRTKDFLKVGVITSILVFLLTISVGYGVMLLLL